MRQLNTDDLVIMRQYEQLSRGNMRLLEGDSFGVFRVGGVASGSPSG